MSTDWRRFIWRSIASREAGDGSIFFL